MVVHTHSLYPTNRPHSAQFKSFLDLAGFLLRLSGHELSVDKYDDPGTSVNKLILALKALGFPLDFPAARLRTGAGEACCAALDFLADRALAAKGVVAWPRPAYPKEDFADEAEVDDDAEVVDADAEEDGPRAHAAADDDGDELMYSDVVQLGKKAAGEDPLEASTNQMILSEVDPLLWRTELERVGPKLRARTAGLASSSSKPSAASAIVDGSGPMTTKEWHSHLERTRTHADVVGALRPTATTQLRTINTQLAQASARLASGEDKLSNQFFENRRLECRELREQLNRAAERSKEGGDRVDAMTRELAALGEQLRAAKAELDTRGAKMTDTSPLVRIKEALKSLAAEIKQFELRIGVVGHTLLQAKARQATRRFGGGGGRDGSATGGGSGYQDPEFDPSDEDSS